MSKKLFSVILSICMVLSLCSFAAFADDTDDTTDTTGETAEPTDSEEPTDGEEPTDSEEPTDNEEEEPTEDSEGEEEINAGFGFNDTWYWIDSDNIVHIDEEGDAVTTSLPDGVTYDYATRTLTFNGAKLTRFYADYSGWNEEENQPYHNQPSADLTIVLEGENSVINPPEGVDGEYNAFELRQGINATIKGSGSLTIEAQNTADDNGVGHGLAISDHSSLTITDSAHVIVKVTGESCNVNEEDSWTDFVAIDGDYNSDNELTVSGNAVLEAYGDCGGIRSIDITAKDNAQIKANMIQLYINTPEEAEADGNDNVSEIEEGLEPRVMTVEDNAVVDVKTSYETAVEGCYEALVLQDGSKLLVKGGTVNITQDSGATNWDNGDTAIGMWYDWDIYNPEDNADMIPSIVVSGGELNVNSCFCGIQSATSNITVSGGTMNVKASNPAPDASDDETVTAAYGIYTYGAYEATTINITGGSLNVDAEATYGYAAILADGKVNVTGGNHRFGDENAFIGLDCEVPISFTGGTTEINGSEYAFRNVTSQEFTEDVENLDPDNLPIDEKEVASSITLGDDMVVTDNKTGSELTTLGSYESVGKGYDGDGNFAAYSYWIDYSYTTDGSDKIAEDEDGHWTNCATSITIAEVPVENPFTDVADEAYYHDAVLWAVKKNVTSGTTETTFSPDESCTRAQMVTFLWRAAGSPAATGSNPFTDVTSDKYYYDAVLWAVEQGITTGTSDTTFSPDATIKRGQTVTFLYRYAGSPAVSGEGSFTDVTDGKFYADAVKWAVLNSITTGTTDTTFGPEDNCTRAQIVTFLYRDLGK